MPYLRLDDFTVPGFDLLVTLGLKFKDADASGDSSSTAKANKGAKGKKLDVKIKIRFRDEEDLRELTRVAEAKAKGDQKIYTVTNRTANAAGMRQAKFTGDFKAEEQEDKRCWQISFCLAEHKSNPELAEGREAAKSATVQQSEGGAVSAEETKPEEAPQLTSFEKNVLLWLNGKIGPSNASSGK